MRVLLPPKQIKIQPIGIMNETNIEEEIDELKIKHKKPCAAEPPTKPPAEPPLTEKSVKAEDPE